MIPNQTKLDLIQTKKQKNKIVKKRFIPVNEPIFIGNEIKYLKNCISSKWIGSDGKYVSEFEKKLSNYTKRKYAIAVSSGTAALDIAFASLKIKKGDEIILPSFTIISCVNEIIRRGAKPVFIDCDLTTWNVNISDIEKKITDKTKVILAVHIYGLSVDMPNLLKLGRKYNIKIIEDSSEVLGLEIKNKKCGSYGDISTFSFYTNKHITTGEGGMILTDNLQIAKRCKKLRNLFFDNKKRFYHKEIGWNYRMSNLNAAVGVAQFENLKKIIKLKRLIGSYYHNSLKNIKNIQLQPLKNNYSKNIFWVFGVVIKKESKINVTKMINLLHKKGIQTRPFFWPLHKQPFLKKNFIPKYSLPNSEYLSKNGFYLPSGLSLKKNDVNYICKEFKKALLKF